MQNRRRDFTTAAIAGTVVWFAAATALPQQSAPSLTLKTVSGTDSVPARTGSALTDPHNPIIRIFGGKRLDLWSLRKPQRVVPPMVRAKTWVRTPVDRFVLAGLEAHRIAPSPEADRRTLIRRLYFDLIGLPPTPEAVKAFVADNSPNAYRTLVERLLASRHYGERWGRYWLDVVRYADTNGFERDEFRPNTFRYRDYVIRAFNTDKPYDQFLREQLAGDEMVGTDQPRTQSEVDKLVATGYMRLGQYDSTGSIFEEDKRGRDQLMADLTNTTASAFLGLTVACANCHNHKYDPISQADHFRLRAFFAGVKFRDDIPADPLPLRMEIEKQNALLDVQIHAVEQERTALFAPVRTKMENERRAALPADIQELLKTDRTKRDAATKERLKPFLAKIKVSDDEVVNGLGETDKKRNEAFGRQVDGLEKQKRPLASVLTMTDTGSTAPATCVFAEGDFTQVKEQVEPGFLSVFDPNPATVVPPASGKSTGRRTALAAWIASPQNPYTARVMVNRIWQHHFGQGLVATPNDFGYSGARPTNPRLLDWLANEFVRSGWSVKQMHRYIVLSAAYRQTSTVEAKRKKVALDNALIWRQNPRRHDAEALRDSMLAVSGLLLPDTDGPPRWPPVQTDLLEAQPSILETHSDEAARKRLEGWYADPIEKTDVRTVFLIQKRCLPTPFLQPFDLQDMMISCPARTNTTVAPQALTLMNNDLTVRAAHAFALRVEREAGSDPAKQVRRAIWLALSHPPDKTEMSIGLGLLARHTAKYTRNTSHKGGDTPARAALTDLCRTLLNVNEFVYVD